MKKQLIILMTIFLSLTACQNANESAKNDQKDKQEKTEIKTETKAEEIREITWVLVELEGESITPDAEKPISFMLHTDENRVSGFAGCNSILGTYTLEAGNRIRFENMGLTLMACPDLEFNEATLMEVFELTDNYTLVNGVLSLNVGKRMPLAVFKAE